MVGWIATGKEGEETVVTNCNGSCFVCVIKLRPAWRYLGAFFLAIRVPKGPLILSTIYHEDLAKHSHHVEMIVLIGVIVGSVGRSIERK